MAGEAGLQARLWVASVLADLRKAYASVSHRKLVQEAAANGFPATIQHLALQMYRAPRRAQFGRSYINDTEVITGRL